MMLRDFGGETVGSYAVCVCGGCMCTCTIAGHDHKPEEQMRKKTTPRVHLNHQHTFPVFEYFPAYLYGVPSTYKGCVGTE